MKNKPIILVADDEPRNIELIKACLMPMGYQIIEAIDGEDAISKVKEFAPDLILLDIMMPKKNGFEVCRVLRAGLDTLFIPIIMVTALSEREDRIKGIEAGADDFLSKPIDAQELVARVKSLLRIKTQHDEITRTNRKLADAQDASLGLTKLLLKTSESRFKGLYESSGDAQALQGAAENLDPDLYKIKLLEDNQREISSYKKLKKIADKIQSVTHIEEVLSIIAQELQSLFEVEGIAIYILDKTADELVAKYRTGNDIEEIRIPSDNNSIAGFVSKNSKMVSVIDAYNETELIKINTELRFDKRWDEKYNKRTKGIIAMPLISNGTVNGVLELITKKNGSPFVDKDFEIAREITATLGIAMNRQSRTSSLKRSKYDILVSDSLISSEEIDAVFKKAKETNETTDSILIKEYNISVKEIVKCYEQYYRTDFIAFSKEMSIPVDLIQNLTLETLKNEVWVPVEKKGNVISIVMENPSDIVRRDSIQFRFKSARLKFCVSTKDDIINIIDLFYGVDNSQIVGTEDVTDILEELKEKTIKTSEEEAKKELKEDNSAIVRLVNQIIELAYALKASDIHIEPYTESNTIIRFRVDGSCQEIMKVPRHYKNALSSRIKIMCNLDISERRLPQDGKIKFKNYGKLDIELRVAVMPTVGGNEDIVMRIMVAGKPLLLDKIGLSENNYNKFKSIIDKPYGLCLVVGPTGSGKTTSLHSALGYLNKPDVKIWTAEDPVEITQHQLRQVQTHLKIGLTFERAMRAFLRCDPDIIMVGEMRDLETTATSIEASLTGHLVLSTLHTNNASETVTRMLDMGIDPLSFADSLLGILAQRLIRTLCPDCKEKYHPDKKEFDLLKEEYGNNELFDGKFKYTDKLTLYQAKEGGCKKCTESGYRGRMGIHELLTQTDQTKAMIHKRAKASELMELAVKEGMVTLKQDGIEKTFKGFTTLREILTVCIR